MNLNKIILIGAALLAEGGFTYLPPQLEKEQQVDKILFKKDINLNEKVIELERREEIKITQKNYLCAEGKSITYTNIDEIDISLFNNLGNWYVDENGFVREQNTGAIYCAMATNYQKNNYYTITTSDNQNFKVKVVDIKSDNHTTNKCYTTHDNSIVELWLTNANNDFKHLGNSRVVGVSVVGIKE